MIVNRSWQKRRVVVTKEAIVFAFVGQDREIDRIPLNEIDFIKEFSTFDSSTEQQTSFRSRHHSKTLQIATGPDGFNSGRTYYLRTASQEHFEELLQFWTTLVHRAKSDADKRNHLQRLQKGLFWIYHSPPYQTAMALFIAAVSARIRAPARPRPGLPPAGLTRRPRAPRRPRPGRPFSAPG